MSNEQKQAYKKVIDSFRPEAKELVKSCISDPCPSTKHNYGKVLSFLSGLDCKPIFKQLFLAAMVVEGYPSETVRSISEIMFPS